MKKHKRIINSGWWLPLVRRPTTVVVRGEEVQSGKETDFNYTDNTVFFTFLNRIEKTRKDHLKLTIIIVLGRDGQD